MIRNRVSTSTATKQHIILKDEARPSNNALWGRRSQVSALSGIISMSVVVTSLLFVLLMFISLQHFNGSFLEAGLELLSSSPKTSFVRFFPRLTVQGGTVYTFWVVLQAALYSVLPGKIARGSKTPGGNTLPYNINGLSSCFMTVGGFCLISWFWGMDTAASLADNWGEVLVAANSYGIVVSVLAWAKGHMIPTCRKDRRLSGSIFHDFLSGIELNPRVGKEWDLKFFQIGRLGMNSWMVLDLSFAAQQYLRFGSVSNSMLIVVALHAIYVVDFFVNEAWYLNTIDITHDHFGFYLAWGSGVWLPCVYTSQAQYLATHPVHLSPVTFWAILSAGILGYVLFRLANNEKHLVRTNRIDCQISGRKPKVIQSRYTTESGQVHESLLLCSGCWAIVRHPNYFGDLIISFCTCVCCGWQHLFPYTYFIHMSILLIHRCLRDEKRCLVKHGQAWEEYRRVVRWRIIPGLF